MKTAPVPEERPPLIAERGLTAHCNATGRSSRAHSAAYPVFPHPKGKNFLDLDEDIQLKDIEHAVQEGFDNIELLKRYSTFGMGPSQGKHSNLNVLRVLCRLMGRDIDAVEMTTARPFVNPVAPESPRWPDLQPPPPDSVAPPAQACRRPLHARRELASAGVLRRQARQGRTAIAAEVTAVRQRVGMIDVGTLGKLEISGPDAAAFIDRIYTGRFAKLQTRGLPIRTDVRRKRSHHRRWRGGAAGAGPLLCHDDHQRLGCRGARDATLGDRLGHERRSRQCDRHLRRDECGRPVGSASAWRRFRPSI